MRHFCAFSVLLQICCECYADVRLKRPVTGYSVRNISSSHKDSSRLIPDCEMKRMDKDSIRTDTRYEQKYAGRSNARPKTGHGKRTCTSATLGSNPARSQRGADRGIARPKTGHGQRDDGRFTARPKTEHGLRNVIQSARPSSAHPARRGGATINGNNTGVSYFLLFE